MEKSELVGDTESSELLVYPVIIKTPYLIGHLTIFLKNLCWRVSSGDFDLPFSELVILD